MQVNAYHLDKNDMPPNSCNFLYFNVVCTGLFVLVTIILISLLALRPSYLHAILLMYFATFHQIYRTSLRCCFSLRSIDRSFVLLIDRLQG